MTLPPDVTTHDPWRRTKQSLRGPETYQSVMIPRFLTVKKWEMPGSCHLAANRTRNRIDRYDRRNSASSLASVFARTVRRSSPIRRAAAS